MSARNLPNLTLTEWGEALEWPDSWVGEKVQVIIIS